MKIPKLFLDANVIFSAVKSSSGGSAKIFRLARTGLVEIYTCSLALYEARKNIAQKLIPSKLIDFYALINSIKVGIRDVEKNIAVKKYGRIISHKDAPILAAAIESKVDFLITLDRKHFFSAKIKKTKFPIKILLPRDFLQRYLQA